MFVNQIILWSLLIVPLLSLFFIGKSNLRRFLPVAWFVTVIDTLIYQAAYHYNWWREAGLFEWDRVANVPWVYVAYPVATIWIFRYTYGRFWLYLIVNLVLDGVYIFGWYPIQQKLGMASGELGPFPTYAMMIGVAVLIYLYQMWQEGELLQGND